MRAAALFLFDSEHPNHTSAKSSTGCVALDLLIVGCRLPIYLPNNLEHHMVSITFTVKIGRLAK